MSTQCDFKNLFICDIANNHQGDIEHARTIIRGVGQVMSSRGTRAALKFQFRDIPTFIHPDYMDRQNVKHIPRFVSTALSKEDYAVLTDEVRRQGLVTMCTPFDEISVDLIMELGIEVIKIASCSAEDHPLLEKVATTGRPVVVSTAGLSIRKIDRLVSFLEHKRVHFALMHCVAIYPTPPEKLQLNQISLLKERFPRIPIGFSTHESPEMLDPVRIAAAKGAELFERHVGKSTGNYSLNAYSSTPIQIGYWVDAWHEARAMMGGEERAPASPEETKSLGSLKRGVYARRGIKSGAVIQRDDVFFAMPCHDGQLTSGNWHMGIMADKDYVQNESLDEALDSLVVPREELIYQIILQVKGLLNRGRVFIGKNSSVEISHHYGLERFREFGCVIIDCVNREYCKKLLVQLPRQKHPYHYHAKKEETFQLLYGDIEMELEGRRTALHLGDTFLVCPGMWHKFHTLDGAIVEEISTTHNNDDSFYEDEKIAKIPRRMRKTSIPNWEMVGG